MTAYDIRTSLLKMGINNLIEFGYPTVDIDNILSDKIYRAFFKSMLESNRGVAPAVDDAINELLAEISELDKN